MSVKDNVLSVLTNAAGSPVSGQELAERLDVSRTAVWKAVNTLRDEGYAISAAQNRGYTLNTVSRSLNPETIRAYRRDNNKQFDIHVYDAIDSTNDQLRRLRLEGSGHGTAVLSELQTSGRGRNGKAFYSPAGSGLYMSMLLTDGVNLRPAFCYTFSAGAAVCAATEMICGVRTSIKWVNDVMLNGKKICGILTEADTDLETGIPERIITGIGINVNRPLNGFPLDISDKCGYITDAEVDRNKLAAALLDLMLEYISLPAPEITELYKSYCDMIDSIIKYRDKTGVHHGIFRDIGDNGQLVMETDNGILKSFSPGSISICI